MDNFAICERSCYEEDENNKKIRKKLAFRCEKNGDKDIVPNILLGEKGAIPSKIYRWGRIVGSILTIWCEKCEWSLNFNVM